MGPPSSSSEAEESLSEDANHPKKVPNDDLPPCSGKTGTANGLPKNQCMKEESLFLKHRGP